MIRYLLFLTHQLKTLELFPEALLNKAQDLYNQWGSRIWENIRGAVERIFMEFIRGFFSDMGTAIMDFFKGLF